MSELRQALQDYLTIRRALGFKLDRAERHPDAPLFVTSRGGPMSHDALQQRLSLYTATAAQSCPSLTSKNVTPHVLRHSAVICTALAA